MSAVDEIYEGVAFQKLTAKELEFMVNLVLDKHPSTNEFHQTVRNLMIQAISEGSETDDRLNWRRIFLSYVEVWKEKGNYLHDLLMEHNEAKKSPIVVVVTPRNEDDNER